ncbi:MAG: hypothetical protein Q9166_007978 [cf. Caloplaca sp. 2 TL-2023]
MADNSPVNYFTNCPSRPPPIRAPPSDPNVPAPAPIPRPHGGHRNPAQWDHFYGQRRHSGIPAGIMIAEQTNVAYPITNIPMVTPPQTGYRTSTESDLHTTVANGTARQVNRLGREASDVPHEILPCYPRTHLVEEPRDIPMPHARWLVQALHPYDKHQIDCDYMGFIIVMERIWPSYLRPLLEEFIKQKGPSSSKKETVDEEVRRLMTIWKSPDQVVKDFPHNVDEPRDWAHLEYECRVRDWHVGQHMEEYQTSVVLRLRWMGYMVGY